MVRGGGRLFLIMGLGRGDVRGDDRGGVLCVCKDGEEGGLWMLEMNMDVL